MNNTHQIRKWSSRYEKLCKPNSRVLKCFFLLLVFLFGFFQANAFAFATTLFSDNFIGTNVDMTKWIERDTGYNVNQNNNLTIVGNNHWDANGVISTSTFARGDSLTIEGVVKASATNTYAMALGYGNWNWFSQTNTNNVFINFHSTGVFRIFRYANGVEAESYTTNLPYVANRLYKVQIVLGDIQGAKFRVYQDANDDGDFDDVGENTDLLATANYNGVSGGMFTNAYVMSQVYSSGVRLTLDDVTVFNNVVTDNKDVFSTITLSTPKSYQVIQRDGSNNANIVITGTYTGSPTAIEASWNGGAYETIVASPTGGTYSGTLSNQTAGQGTLTVRFVNSTEITASASYVGIGDIFVIAGQSNASGRGTNNQIYSHASLKATMFGNDDSWKELADPTDSGTGQVDSVSNDSANSPGGTVWPLIATLYMADQGVPVAFIPTAMGATNITQWQRNNSNPGDTTTLYGSMYRRINAVGGSVKAILFWQGESDAVDGTSQSTYKTKVETFANDAYTDFGVKTVLAQIGDFTTYPGASVDNVRLGQIDAWNDGGNILVGPGLYDVNTTDYVHFTTNSELQTAANRWWAAIEKDLYAGSDGRGPILTAAEYNSAKTQVRLTFTDGTLPLLPTSGLSGFTVKDNGSTVSISSISRTASNQLTITLTSAASGTITVSLGEGHSGKGATVPTDSSTYNLPAETFVNHATTPLDDSAPTISSISSSKTNGSYKIGEVIPIDVTFSEAVTSTGSVTVTLETGTTDRTCTFTVTNSSTGTCNYTVQTGDTTSDLNVNTVSGTIQDQAANPMVNFVPATNLSTNKDLVIDTTAPITLPTISSPSAYWKLEEASGTRADELGISTITDNGSVTRATGKIGYAAQFNGTSQSLSHADSATLSTGDTDFTIGAWVNLSSKSGYRVIVAKYDTSINQREYLLYYDSITDRFKFTVSSNGTDRALTTVLANNLGSPALNTWYYVVAWHDATANTINIQINNGAVNSASHTTGVLDSTSGFRIGANSEGFQYFSGKIDSVGIWKKVLTVIERAALYNSGIGLEYPFGTTF